MLIPFPRQFSYTHAFSFAGLLATVLLGEGNPPGVCLTVLSIIMVGTFAFNLAGGIASPTGAYVFFTVLFTGVAGTVTKAVLNEPLLENVVNADQTLLVYLGGTCAMTAAVYGSKKLSRQTPLLANRLTDENTTRVVVGCLAAGVLLPYFLYNFLGGGGVASIVRQLNVALPLSVLIAVYQKTRQTGGRSSFSWPALIGASYGTYTGLIGFSKEGIFSSWLAWVVAAAAARLRVTWGQVLLGGGAALLAVSILVPYAQYGRNFRVGGSNETKALELLAHPLETRRLALAGQDSLPLEAYHWYQRPEGIMDRLTLVPIDSALIALTDRVGPSGYSNIEAYFINILPHFILPDKPTLNTGNQYAHEIGLLSREDTVTGISFSPFSEAYRVAGWKGEFVVLPCILLLLFTVMQSVAGNTDQTPWGLFYIAAFGHLAAEGSLAFPVYIASFGTEALVATAFFMVYVTPIMGGLILGPGQAPSRRVRVASPVARRAI